MSLVSWWFILRPDLAITPQQPLNKYDPFSVPFVLKNNGKFEMAEVSAGCHVRYMEDASRNQFTDTSASDKVLDVARIAPGGEHTIPCLLPLKNIGAWWTKADMELLVSFRYLPVISIHHTKRARYAALRDVEGSVRWTTLALD
jgi:hypothetical protein